MATVPGVVEDAKEEHPDRRERPQWGWLVAGIVIGAGASLLVFGGAETTTVAPTTPPTETTTTVSIGRGGVSEAVPGFPDGLAAVVRGAGRSQELVIWPLAGEPHRRPVPFGSPTPPVPVAFDPSGRRVASLLPGPERLGGLLYAGIPESATLLAADANGYAWHDTEPARLAYTTVEEGETLLWVAGDNQTNPELVARAVGIDGGVAAWGVWGYALESGDSIVLLTDLGEIKAVSRGRVLASDGEGWMAVENAGLWLLSSGGGLVGLHPAPPLDGPVVAAEFSPDGSAVAVLTQTRLHLLDRGGALLADPVFVRPRLPAQVGWSSDGEYVLVPGFRGLAVLDVGTGVLREVLGGEVVTGMTALPIGEP